MGLVSSNSQNNHFLSAGLLRRSGAVIYDGFVILAIEMMAAGLIIAAIFALNAVGILEYAPYVDAADLVNNHPIIGPLFSGYLIVVWCYFFIFFWKRAGQTLGMRAWKLQVQSVETGSNITMKQAFIRLVCSGFGVMNFSLFLFPSKQPLHDIVAKTEVIVLPKVR